MNRYRAVPISLIKIEDGHEKDTLYVMATVYPSSALWHPQCINMTFSYYCNNKIQ
jgi:hypothetical protein